MSSRAISLAASGILALASAGALTGALVLASTSGASASGLSGTLAYSCGFAENGSTVLTEAIDIGITATAPTSVSAGSTFSLTDAQTNTIISASLIQLLEVAVPGIKDLGGTVSTFNFNATGATPATINVATSPFSFEVPIHAGQSATITAPASPESVGPFTAGSSGTISITPGTIVINAKSSKATLVVTCTPPSSIPATSTASITISSSSSSSSTGSSSPTPTTISTVPSTHTGEPWSGWPYWALVGMFALLGLFAVERSVRIRRRSV